ncbi:MAG: hypothetical protein JSR82_01780 [Verrucomicrobia bacterium]|nr:hypothetical protein [Verrucomicrobiota bacterium]
MLIDQLQTLCQRLNGQGWGRLFQNVAGLNINQPSAAALGQELARVLPAIDRNIPGFEDFNPAGQQGITPGVPSASLFYHALASPGVTAAFLTGYPTLADLDLVENYIFALVMADLDALRIVANGRPLGVVTFAYEYRPAVDTVQGAYADWVLSRSGVQRVGNTAAAYVPELRAFTPWQANDGDAVIRVLPARYAAFIAVKMPASDNGLGVFGPLDRDMMERVVSNRTLRELLPTPHHEGPRDGGIDFWVPIHKLFSGPECLRDYVADEGLHVDFEVEHRNLKLQRQWQYLASIGYPLDLVANNVNAAPFVRTDQLASRSLLATDGPCLVVPAVHAAFNAQVNLPNSANPLPFPVMPDFTGLVRNLEGDDEASGWLWSSMNIPTDSMRVGGRWKIAHRAPEYVNVRGRIEADGRITDLNQTPDLMDTLEAGGFNAQTLEDYSADGWIAPLVPELENEIDPDDFVSAYSLVTAPAFFPFVRQRELMLWTVDRFSRPNSQWAKVWNILPVALCHDRIAPNVKLQGSGFEVDDLSATAIVSLPAPASAALPRSSALRQRRVSFLPDAAAGTYAPGWETSYDRGPGGEPFLAAYGLGSPFPEDAMICSALGTYWPGPAPDTSRLFASIWYRTEAPLTDAEVGIPAPATSWDTVPAPVFNNDGTITFANPIYVDYTRNAILRVKPFMDVDTREYTSRVLAMYNALNAVGVEPNVDTVPQFRSDAPEWRVVLFRPSSVHDQGFLNAFRAANPGGRPAGPVYEMRLVKLDEEHLVGEDGPQITGTILPGEDYTLYTYSAGALYTPTGQANWDFEPAAR